VTATDDIRRWAMALPEVEETSHFRFHVPVWKVGGRTFLGMGKDETTAVFCISEQEAGDAAAAEPAELDCPPPPLEHDHPDSARIKAIMIIRRINHGPP